jgi:DUF1009 family protein
MKFGLIAGNGKFPFMVLEGARQAGVQMAVAAIGRRQILQSKAWLIASSGLGLVNWDG